MRVVTLTEILNHKSLHTSSAAVAAAAAEYSIGLVDDDDVDAMAIMSGGEEDGCSRSSLKYVAPSFRRLPPPPVSDGDADAAMAGVAAFTIVAAADADVVTTVEVIIDAGDHLLTLVDTAGSSNSLAAALEERVTAAAVVVRSRALGSGFQAPAPR